jgi:trehalose-6-phosphate synthase
MDAALEMPLSERSALLARFRHRVTAWTAEHWLSAQLGDLRIDADQRMPAGAP